MYDQLTISWLRTRNYFLSYTWKFQKSSRENTSFTFILVYTQYSRASWG